MGRSPMKTYSRALESISHLRSVCTLDKISLLLNLKLVVMKIAGTIPKAWASTVICTTLFSGTKLSKSFSAKFKRK